MPALTGVTLDQSVLNRDHSQKVFDQTFEQFSGRMVPPRMTRGSNMLKQYGSVLSRIEQTYGVPAEVLVAIWGLETDFGVNIGKFQTLRSLATLAYDCRRADEFRGEFMDALRIVDRGDLAPQEMRGAWAGELGQTQFMPSSWMKYAVDFDGNGRRDLLHNVPDVLASTANYLANYGWKKGKDYQPGAPNFAVLQQWNKSEVYAKTVAYFASQLAQRAVRSLETRRPIAVATGPLPLICYRGRLTSPCCSACALFRCMPHPPMLPLSMASCAAAISFSAANLLSPSAMTSIADSVFARLALLQPPPIWAACAGATANATAAMAAAPSKFLSMLLSFSFCADPTPLPDSAK